MTSLGSPFQSARQRRQRFGCQQLTDSLTGETTRRPDRAGIDRSVSCSSTKNINTDDGHETLKPETRPRPSHAETETRRWCVSRQTVSRPRRQDRDHIPDDAFASTDGQVAGRWNRTGVMEQPSISSGDVGRGRGRRAIAHRRTTVSSGFC